MRLGDRQRAFARMVPRLIDKAHEMGYEVTGGDWLRDRRCQYGSKKSKHHTKEAIDLNLFLNNKYLRKTSDHKELGEWWESAGGVWGGRFKDGNHYQGSSTGLYTPETPNTVDKIYSVTVKSIAPIIITEDTV